MSVDITCISDLHGYLPDLPTGDLLILAGDYTATDKILEWAKFFDWLKRQKYQKKILIAGNHDNFLVNAFPKNQNEADDLKEMVDVLDENDDFEYLCDSGTEYKGFKIWGTPWTNWFHGVHPKCKAFMINESKLESKFTKIPSDIDILITHGPPYLILDNNVRRKPCGSLSLRYQLDTRVFPKMHFFGHIHEQQGKYYHLERTVHGIEKLTKCFNVSYVDEKYRPSQKIQTFQL